METSYLILNDRQMCDLEMLLIGGFSPLKGFLNKDDYHCVLDNLRLTTGELWPIPIVLSANADKAVVLNVGDTITLRNKEFLPIATMIVEDIYQPDIQKECEKIFGCVDDNHPYMSMILANKNVMYVGGPVTQTQIPPHFDFIEHRLTPKQTKNFFKEKGWTTIVGFQTRNPMHRSHIELTKFALNETGDKNAKLLIHPVVGVTQSCDVPYPIRVRCYQKLLKHYPENTAALCLLPLNMRMAGPREALWHALIRQNYGCTHFVVGRDHAGPSITKKNGEKFFGPYDTHNLLAKYQSELKIKIIPSKWIVYVKEIQGYLPIDQVEKHWTVEHISGTQQRQLLRDGKSIPDWFTYPDIVEELKCAFQPKYTRGFCVYFVGLSGSGKTTLTKALKAKLEELLNHRKVTVLDGDVVRKNLSSELGFSKEHRSLNVRRIGYVASEIVKHGGICLCANIAPYQNDRDYNRNQIGDGYIEIYIDTSMSVCESRDVKGLYKLAREGKIKKFTGVSDPFEIPANPELTVSCANPKELVNNVDAVLKILKEKEFIR